MVEVEIEWKGKKEIVELRPLTFGELLEISKKTMKRRVVNNTVIEDTDETEMAILTLLKSIVRAPFEVNRENILALEGKWAYKLMDVANRLNSFRNDEEQNISENA